MSISEEEERKKHFRNALSNYMPVLGIVDSFQDPSEEAFPEEWSDPLDLYGGYLQELRKRGLDLEKERRELLGLLETKDPHYVWGNRKRLVAERIFIEEF